jgi:hypothetical protein
MDTIEEITKRLNASNMLTAVLKATGPVEIKMSELEKILKYQKPEDLQNFSAIDTYLDTFTDYIKESGGYVQLDFNNETQSFIFTLMSKEKAEELQGQNDSIGYVCVRSRWNDYAHS